MTYIKGRFEKPAYKENKSFKLYHNLEGDNYNLHWHPAVEVIYPIENNYVVEVNNKSYNLQERDILIIPSNEIHKINAPCNGSRIIFQFDFSLISTLKGFSNIITLLLQIRYITPQNSNDIHSQIEESILHISNEYKSQNDLYDVVIYSEIIKLFVIITRKYIHLTNHLSQEKEIKQKEAYKKFIKSFNYINENYVNDISLEDVAEHSGFSKYYFSRLFKQFSDLNFYDYLNQIRIRAVETQLLQTDLSITEIALNCGFNSIATFNRVFKSIKNCTPSEFKSLYRCT